MVFKFRPKKEPKEVINVTVDKSNMDMLKVIMKGYGVGLATATNDVLNYFRKELWEKDIIAKNKEEAEEEDSEEAKKS